MRYQDEFSDLIGKSYRNELWTWIVIGPVTEEPGLLRVERFPDRLKATASGTLIRLAIEFEKQYPAPEARAYGDIEGMIKRGGYWSTDESENYGW